MNLVKSLLLGSAAGLVAVAGAQAADLPVKAKAVEYVKVCSAYGPGFYYVPGTDTCLKVGGYVRFDTYVNAVGTFRPAIVSTAGAAFNGPGNGGNSFPFHDEDDADYNSRARGSVDLDARTQTDYGTLRSYARFGAEWNSVGTGSGSGSGPASGLYFDRAFIQFAGFTFGYTQSFFDSGTNYAMTQLFAGSNTKTAALAYTAQFGNGFSASVALEDAAYRNTGVQGSDVYGADIYATNGAAFGPFFIDDSGAGLGYTNASAGQQAPDIVGNLRLDQAWGTLMVSGALHQVRSVQDVFATSSTDTWGWAIGGSVEFKVPVLGEGDSLYVQANYADGAINYAGLSGNDQGVANGWGRVKVDSNGSLTGAYVPLADAVVSNVFGDVNTSTAWSVQGQFRHFWTPGLRSVVFGGYSNYEPGDSEIFQVTKADLWQVGTDLVWSPVKNLDLGAEVLYSKVKADAPLQGTAYQGGNYYYGLIGGDTDVWSGGIRAERRF